MFDELTHQTGTITMATKRPGMETKCIKLVTAIRRPSIFFIGLGLWSLAQMKATPGPANASMNVFVRREKIDTGQLKETCNP